METENMYKKMYLLLFNKITDALKIDNLAECWEILINAQQQAEEICIDSFIEIQKTPVSTRK